MPQNVSHPKCAKIPLQDLKKENIFIPLRGSKIVFYFQILQQNLRSKFILYTFTPSGTFRFKTVQKLAKIKILQILDPKMAKITKIAILDPKTAPTADFSPF